MSSKASGIKLHYEKVIALCCFLIIFVDIGFPSTSFSVYQPYIVELPGVGHGGGSIVLAVRTFASLVALFFVSRYYAALDVRKGVLAAMLCVAAGFGLYALADGLVGLCVAAVVAGVGYGLGGMVASTMLINRWFKAGVGTIAGFAAVGSGAASLILPPVVVAIVENASLSWAFGAEALLALAVGAVVFALLRNYPADLGLAPYEGKPGEGRAKRSRRPRVSRDMPSVLSPAVFVVMTFIGSISVVGASYLGVLFTSEGFSTESAAWMIAVWGGCLTLGKFLNGRVFDLVGTRNGSAIFFVILLVGLGLCCASDMGNPGLALAAAVFTGFGISLGTVGTSVWSIELAPKGREVQSIRNFQVGYNLGGFLFNLVPGFLMEACGTYLVSYQILFAMGAVSMAFIVGLYTFLDARAKRAA